MKKKLKRKGKLREERNKMPIEFEINNIMGVQEVRRRIGALSRFCSYNISYTPTGEDLPVDCGMGVHPDAIVGTLLKLCMGTGLVRISLSKPVLI